MRARGSDALLNAKFEATYGTPPAGNYMRMPFIQSQLGEVRGLLESDLLGQGREPYDPSLDVSNNDGDLVVPVDVRAIGHWLRLALGNAVSAEATAAGMTIPFTAQPAADSTITIGSTVFTAKASGATGNQFNIGANIGATVTALATKLNASVVAEVAAATYADAGTSLTITFDTEGPAGNALGVAVSPDFGATLPSATLSGGGNSHTFTSGASALPSMSIETALPAVPSFGMNFGARLNTLRIALTRAGLLNATLGMICKGETIGGATGAGTPTSLLVERFQQATGEIKKDGAQLASVVSAEMGYSNNLDKVETIRPDGRIEDADPGMAAGTGNAVVRFSDHVMLDAATSGDPCALSFGWTKGPWSLIFTYPRVFLPKPKRPITGPAGIQASFDWQASAGDGGHLMTAVLTNDVAAYA